jgi:hypothetical protein
MSELNSVIVDEVEPSLDELEIQAVKQLLIELKTIKKIIYDSGTLINGVLIIQIKGILKALMRKYNEYGLLVGENVTLKLSDYSKHASIDFVYSQRLLQLIAEGVD